MKSISRLFSILLVFCFCIISQINFCFAQPDSTKLRYFELSIEEVLNLKLVTASKTPRLSSEITQRVDIVNNEQIGEIVSGNRNLSEYLQYLPGASVKVLSRNDANWGAYGGIGPKYNTYMLNGLPIDAFIDPMNLDILAIDHIEIQRGPASILYPNYLSQDFAGNQSPLAGTVNLILKEIIDQPETAICFGYGSYSTYTGKAYHHTQIGKVVIFGGVSYEKSDYTDYGSEGSWLNMLDNPEYKNGKVFIGSHVYLDKEKKQKLSTFFNQTIHKGNTGRENRKYDFKYSLFNIAYSGQIQKNIDVEFKTGFRWYDRLWEEDNYDTIFYDQSLSETDGVKQLIIPLDLAFSYKHFKKSFFTVGADYQHASYYLWKQIVDNDKSCTNDADVSQIGIYMQEEVQFEKLSLRTGARYNNINYNIFKISGDIPGYNNQKWGIFLWSCGTKYRFSDRFSIFANSGNSFMSPGLKSIGGTLKLNDMFVTGRHGQLPNPDLKPENGVSVDFGMELSLHKDINIVVRSFSTNITDAIIDNVISQNPSQSMSVNARGRTNAKGIELSISQNLSDKFKWFSNLTYTNSEIDDPDNPDGDGVEVPFAPKFRCNIGFTVKLPNNITLSPWMHYSGKIYDSSSKTLRNSFHSKEVVSLFLSKNIQLSEELDFDVFIKAYNITNNRYDMPWQFRDPGFSLTLGGKLLF